MRGRGLHPPSSPRSSHSLRLLTFCPMRSPGSLSAGPWAVCSLGGKEDVIWLGDLRPWPALRAHRCGGRREVRSRLKHSQCESILKLPCALLKHSSLSETCERTRKWKILKRIGASCLFSSRAARGQQNAGHRLTRSLPGTFPNGTRSSLLGNARLRKQKFRIDTTARLRTRPPHSAVCVASGDLSLS